MGAVFVDIDAADIFGIDIAGNVISAVDDQAGFALTGQLPGKDGAVKTGTDDQIIIHKINILSFGR